MTIEKKPCGCGGGNGGVQMNSGVNAQEVLLPGCTPTVSAEVCVEANVTVTPTVVAGRPIVNCVGTPSLTRCRDLGYTPSTTGTCTFTFSQVLCVNIPITFDATVEATRGVVACGNAFPVAGCPIDSTPA
ncbi:hypothetical protein [Paenisporosarcina sp.]|uniref:hypothetical protein n=1 Tax=Paenisporosarcina sp. TaxID=1932001 RepID=UPI003C78BAE1